MFSIEFDVTLFVNLPSWLKLLKINVLAYSVFLNSKTLNYASFLSKFSSFRQIGISLDRTVQGSRQTPYILIYCFPLVSAIGNSQILAPKEIFLCINGYTFFFQAWFPYCNKKGNKTLSSDRSVIKLLEHQIKSK